MNDARKPVMITVSEGRLIALCNDSTLFQMDRATLTWEKLPAIPQPWQEKKDGLDN